MVVLGFFIFMTILFFSALFFIILNLILIIIWKLRKRNGKNPKKRYIVITTIFLIISMLVGLIPIVWLSFVRAANNRSSKNVIMAESGKIVYWGISKNGDSTIERFEMDGKNYVELGIGGSKNTWELGKPVANVRYKSDEDGVHKFMGVLFAYNKPSTLYPIVNNERFDLYTIGSNIYSPENDKDVVSTYYKDISNYNTQNCTYEYAVFSESKDAEAEKSKTSSDYINKYESVNINKNTFETLYKISDSRNLETIKIPEKYIDIRNKKNKGDPLWGYDNRRIYVYSKDKVTSKQVELDLIDGQIYRETGTGDGNIKGYRLPNELNEYIKNEIFREF